MVGLWKSAEILSKEIFLSTCRHINSDPKLGLGLGRQGPGKVFLPQGGVFAQRVHSANYYRDSYLYEYQEMEIQSDP